MSFGERILPVALLTLSLLSALPGRGAAAQPDLPSLEVHTARGGIVRADVWKENGADYISAPALIEWLSATREWDSRLEKLTLKFESHVLRLTVDTRWVEMDGRLLQLDAPVLQRRNLVWIPISALGEVLPPGLRMLPNAEGTRLLAESVARRGAAGDSLARWNGRLVRILLDPGHGGADSGVVAGGLCEAEVTLSLGLSLKSELEREGNFKVFLTREDRSEVPAMARVRMAARERCELMVSLHADAGPPGMSGFAVIAPPQRGEVAGPAPVSRDPVKPGALRPAPALRPWERSAEAHATAADSLAHTLVEALAAATGNAGRGVLHRPLLAFEGLDIPAVMVECGALTSEPDALVLSSPAGQARLVAALAGGIRAYLTAGAAVAARP